MRKRGASIFALTAVLAVACAGIAIGYKPPIVKIGNWEEVVLSGGFKPTKLPKSKPAPIHLGVEGTVNAPDGTHPPALQEVILETDRNATIAAKGLASCTAGKIVGPDVVPPSQGGCKAARIGKGELEFEVEFAEQAPFVVKGHAIAFNAGVKYGVTTIPVYAYLSNPVSETIISPIEVSKIHHGPYGSKWTATIPVVAGGSGSLKKFKLEFFRMFAYEGKRRSYLLAKCPGGRLQAAWKATLSDGSGFAGKLVRPCTPTG